MTESTVDPPKPTGKPATEVSLTGMLIPWSTWSPSAPLGEDQPVLLNMPGSPSFYLPCFTTEDKLRQTMGRAKIEFQKIKRIDDGREFLASIEAQRGVVVIVDPHFLENGRVRFTEIRSPSYGSHEDPSTSLGMQAASKMTASNGKSGVAP